MKKFESSEDYLERILMLSKKIKNVRSIDIVNDMKYSKPSVSIAMKKLKDKGLILIDNKGYITLTLEGEQIANNMYERHNILTKMLISLGVSEEQALEDACKIEHDLSEETFLAIKKHFEQK